MRTEENAGPGRDAIVNEHLARANAEAAELLAELEQKNDQLAASISELARANVRSAELVAEVEEKNDLLSQSNKNLARANARSAELVAELQARREEVEWANTGLRQAHEETKRILGVASHDVRSGLGGISGFSDLLCDQLIETDPEAGEQAKLIRDECKRLLDLLENLLNESCSRMGGEELRTTSLDLGELVGASIEIQNGAAIRKGQRITARLGREGLLLDADPVRVRQVLDNLISNALKYSPPAAEITVELLHDEGNVGVAVLDQGPGLTDEDLEKVFGEFTQLSAKPTGGEESHGLGLSIARKVVEQHGGRIWAENREDGDGASFGFVLPRAVTVSRSCRVLVADDELLNRNVTGALLRKAGHTVHFCQDGREAVEAVRNDDFDLVLMDAEMPEMNGREATLAIRGMDRDEEHLPIIAVTGHTDPAHLSECLDSRMNDTISKPVTAESLKALLSKWVRPRRSSPVKT